jgi:hypothetical protein
MILNFPYLHKDEILYSGIARYYDYLNEDRIKWVADHLFNSRQFTAIVGFPAGLERFHKNLPMHNPYTPEYIVENHSIYPLFRPFLDVTRNEKIINDMVYKNGMGVQTRVGVVSFNIPNKRNLYYCASCIKEQMDKQNPQFLDVFWNRVHQCPGIFVCHKHREWLKKTKFSLDEVNKHKYISLGNLIDTSQLDLSVDPIEENKISELHVRLAENVEWILNNNLPPRDLNYYRSRYKEYLKTRNTVKLNGRVFSLRLKELFLDYYPEDFLQQLNSNFDVNDKSTWIQTMIQKNRISSNKAYINDYVIS